MARNFLPARRRARAIGAHKESDVSSICYAVYAVCLVPHPGDRLLGHARAEESAGATVRRRLPSIDFGY